jgi:large conductance mechanosensitive channel
MSMIKEFKEFAIKGNMIDMAVGIIIGAAFGKIVSSLVKDVIMPPLGILIGGVDFKDLAVTLKDAAGDAPAVTLNYGMFIQTCVDFLIVAFAIFMAVKVINALKKKEEAKPAEPPKPSREEELLTEIRDLLKK